MYKILMGMQIKGYIHSFLCGDGKKRSLWDIAAPSEKKKEKKKNRPSVTDSPIIK